MRRVCRGVCKGVCGSEYVRACVHVRVTSFCSTGWFLLLFFICLARLCLTCICTLLHVAQCVYVSLINSFYRKLKTRLKKKQKDLDTTFLVRLC